MRDDENKWSELWRSIAPRLLAYLSSFGSLGADDRQDIVQRAFIKAWNVRGFLRDGDLAPWFIRVARNQALDLVKSRARESRRFPSAPPMEDGKEREITGRFPGPDEETMDREKAAFMERFLEGLTDAEREASHLRYAEDLSYPEIARLMKCPLGTVKWRAAELRRKLEAAYREEFGP